MCVCVSVWGGGSAGGRYADVNLGIFCLVFTTIIGGDRGRPRTRHQSWTGDCWRMHRTVRKLTNVETMHHPLFVLSYLDCSSRFVSVTHTFEPIEDGLADRCFISKSLDSTRSLHLYLLSLRPSAYCFLY